MTKSICHLLPAALLPQLACLVLLALHQTHRPLISAQTFLSIALGSFLTETISTHYCSHLRFGKNCQQAISLSEPLHDFLCSTAFLPNLARCPETPTRQPRRAVTQCSACRSYQSIQVSWATGAPLPSSALTETWADTNEKGLPHFF